MAKLEAYRLPVIFVLLILLWIGSIVFFELEEREVETIPARWHKTYHLIRDQNTDSWRHDSKEVSQGSLALTLSATQANILGRAFEPHRITLSRWNQTGQLWIYRSHLERYKITDYDGILYVFLEEEREGPGDRLTWTPLEWYKFSESRNATGMR